MSNNDEKEFRLRPRKPSTPKGQGEAWAWSLAFKRIMHFARMSRSGAGPKKGVRPSRSSAQARFQRCAVRVTYTRNTTRGQWRAHGRYVARESATFEADPKGAGFDQAGQGIDVAGRLEQWQANRDRLFWKLILSPEFGDRVDLERLTREVMKGIEKDLGTPLEWVAVAHHNTEHPHAHVALRGVRGDMQPLQLERRYIQEGIRAVAEDFCTRQLGYRTEQDAAEAERREVQEKRFTSLDRIILKRGEETADSRWLHVSAPPGGDRLSESSRVWGRHFAARLAVLTHMGLAVAVEPGAWRVRRDFESVLRAMQRTSDRQKMLAAQGVLMSDERLPMEILDRRRLNAVEGRVLVHGEDEVSGHSYLMLEGTDAKVYLIHHTPEMEAVRSRGGLRINSFIRLRKLFVDGRPALEVNEMGDSESILKNRTHLETAAQRLIKRGVIPTEDGWGGWLGRYQAALRETALRLEQEREQSNVTRPRQRQRDRDRSHGR
jgi:type IV secretory pathway VirD2 relaxase